MTRKPTKAAKELGAKIREARDKRGWSTYDLADRLTKAGTAITQSAVSQWEKGKTMPNPRKFRAIATELNLDLPLPTGEREAAKRYQRTVRLVGYVGVGAQIFSMGDDLRGVPPEMVEAPPTEDDTQDLVAVRVRGNEMAPAYFDGNLIYYDEHGTDPGDAVGKEVVVCLEDGTLLVKRLGRGRRPDCFDLISYNGTIVEDQFVRWAAPIRWVKKY